MAKLFLLLAVAASAACGGGTGPQLLVDPTIELAPTGFGGYQALPVRESLGDVSNNGQGYTGEIDRYEITTPAPGRLQVSLSWNHDADFDVVVAADPDGQQTLAIGNEFEVFPEYVGLVVASGQTLYIFVAGWIGDPGDYTLEVILLPPTAPVFGIEPNFEITDLLPENGPLVIPFSVELDPDQELDEHVFMVTNGHVAEGEWCVEGRNAVFYPRLRSLPFEDGGLLIGREYTVQFPRAARGPRAVTGEYLSVLVGGTVFVGLPVDPDPAEPPRVVEVQPGPGEAWNGRAMTVLFSEPLDPDTLTPGLFEVVTEEEGALIPFSYQLAQAQDCDGFVVRLEIALDEDAPSGSTVRLVLPATVLGVSGEDVSHNALAGPDPAAGGTGFAMDFDAP